MTNEQLRAHARTAINARLDTIDKEREALRAQIAELDFTDNPQPPIDQSEPTTPIHKRKYKKWSKAAKLRQSARSRALWAARKRKGLKRKA